MTLLQSIITRSALCTVLCILHGSRCIAQNVDALPPYQPQQQVSGTIHVWGHVFFKKVMHDWEEGFRKFQPGIQFEDNLVSSAAATGALFTRTAEIGVVGRE